MPTPHYDGDYNAAQPVGAPVVEDLLLEQARLFRVKFHQLHASYLADRPSFSDRGADGYEWAGLPLVEYSPATDLGGGLCEWTGVFASVPPTRSEFEQFAYEYQYILSGTLRSISLAVRSRLVKSYFYTSNPNAISCVHAYRISPLTDNSWIHSGTAPPVEATEFLGEDETITRWKGFIWEKHSRMVPKLTPATLA